MNALSLRLRLILLFTLAVSLIWVVAGGFAFFESHERIDEFFDTQQMLFARRLATSAASATSGMSAMPAISELGGVAGFPQDETEDMDDPDGMPHGRKIEKGEFEDDALGFAIFGRAGRLLLDDGKKGATFAFEPERRGFVESRLRKKNGKEGNLWRIVWLDSADGQFVVAVGQEQDYRHDLALSMISGQLLPWVLGFPVLLVLVFIAVSRELAPLKRVTRALERRLPEDTAPLDTKKVPREVRPLVEALNRLFVRTNALLARERAFISDAAHELRSPLAALRVQTEVAQLADGGADDDLETRRQALSHLTAGINRATRLVEQLLALSRLEAMEVTDGANEADEAGKVADGETGGPKRQAREAMLPFQPLDWAASVDAAIREQQATADDKGIRIAFARDTAPGQNEGSEGNPPLVALLLRNLFDNAVRYTPLGGSVDVRFDAGYLTIANTGPGLSAHDLSRLNERFFRPPGQKQSGSGLGLPIVMRIARLHGWGIGYSSKPGEGMLVKVSFGPRGGGLRRSCRSQA